MNRIYRCNLVNWYLYTIILIFIFNFIGLLVLFFYEKQITIGRIVIHTVLALFFVIFAYLRRVIQIEFKNNEMIIYKNFRKYKDIVSNFKATEKIKVTRTLHKYKQLIIRNKKINKNFRIDSDEWKDYKEIKAILFEKGVMENNNE